MAGNLIIMCGIPGSGKSTWIKNHLRAAAAYWVSRDKIRFEMMRPGDSYFTNEKEVYNTFCKITENLLKENKNVIADATFLNKKSRSSFLDKINIKPNHTKVVVLDTPIEVCLDRNENREGLAKVPAAAIVNMANSFSMPTLDEGFDKIEVIKNE